MLTFQSKHHLCGYSTCNKKLVAKAKHTSVEDSSPYAHECWCDAFVEVARYAYSPLFPKTDIRIYGSCSFKAWPNWTTLFANMSIIMFVECSWTFHVVHRSCQIGQHCSPKKFDPSQITQIKCCLCCFSCCLKMHGQVERKPCLHFATGMGAH